MPRKQFYEQTENAGNGHQDPVFLVEKIGRGRNAPNLTKYKHGRDEEQHSVQVIIPEH